jgi:hypothetical protein
MTQERNNKELINELKGSLLGSHARITLEKALKGLKPTSRGKVPEGMPYSIWQLVEHIRIAQWDMLSFSYDPSHQSPEWPDGYWIKDTAPASEKAWTDSLHQIKQDSEAFVRLLERPGADLFVAFAHGQGQSLLREALQIIDHNSYHTGEIVALRRIMGDWKL